MSLNLSHQLLLSGVPGAGKSSFADWLAGRGYAVLKGDVDTFQVNAILSTTSRGLTVLVKAIGIFRRPVVIEIGFQPEDHWTTAVRTMMAARGDRIVPSPSDASVRPRHLSLTTNRCAPMIRAIALTVWPSGRSHAPGSGP
jgi:hypothetical protein